MSGVSLPSIYLNKLKELLALKTHRHSITEIDDQPQDVVHYEVLSEGSTQIPEPATQSPDIYYDTIQ